MTRHMIRLTAGAAALLLCSLPVLAEDYIKIGDSSLGKVLTDAKGMTLYTFDKDAGGKSACYDACATNWPPYLADEEDAPDAGFGLLDRTDGTKQWTQGTMPLYTWVKDAAPGDVTGDGFKGMWHAAKP